ncbi:MAG: hypothetical protein EBR22_04300 [Cytophagia bacterium]|nr:hypothetical protein [Cytophagia bacterium]
MFARRAEDGRSKGCPGGFDFNGFDFNGWRTIGDSAAGAGGGGVQTGGGTGDLSEDAVERLLQSAYRTAPKTYTTVDKSIELWT